MAKVNQNNLVTAVLVCCLLVLLNINYSYAKNNNESICTLEMFQNDSNAFWACQTLDSLQHNWFPSPIAGLYTWLDWNGLNGFWQNGVVLQAMTDFAQYTKSKRYMKVLTASWRSVNDLTHAYYPTPSCDDELWYGLSFASIYEMNQNKTFLKTSEDIFKWTWTNCWDTSMTCNGGLYFTTDHLQKITITNAQAFLLGAKLYRLTKDVQYFHKSQMILNYFVHNQVINSTTYLVSDTLDAYSCLPHMRLNLTYNSGVILGGFLELYKVTNNSDFLDTAHKMAKANILENSIKGIFTEYCDLDSNCEYDEDAKAFKGIFLSNLKELMNYSNATQLQFYNDWIQRNIDSVTKKSQCTKKVSKCQIRFVDGVPKINVSGPLFGENWHGPFQYAAPSHQMSALSLFIAGISPNTTCIGNNCNFDPDPPALKKLTCDDKPCPKYMPCCTWDHVYYTCCSYGQQCKNGGCY